MWDLAFITEDDFTKHVANTIHQYGSKLISYDLSKFNVNKIDPVKLLFDKKIYGYDWDDIIKNELSRQRDKSSNNDIGYFHQRIFNYIDGCSVPTKGWDVILEKQEGFSLEKDIHVKRIYVEMKNKHNTMNSSSSAKTYSKMQGQLLSDDDCACFLVEIIAKQSQNITWQCSIDGARQRHKRIRRVSIDEFYKLVTGEDDAFKQVCTVLPTVINRVLSENSSNEIPQDTVIDELYEFANNHQVSIDIALFLLGFNDYIGFG